jgi:hypothetical protein
LKSACSLHNCPLLLLLLLLRLVIRAILLLPLLR